MKIGISGTHGTGKSYTLYELANKYKIDYPNKEVTVITEVARQCPFEINQNASLKAQQWMISKQIQMEIEAEKNCDVVITDRTLVDYLAYTKYGYREFFHRFLPYLKYYVSSYDKIYFKSLMNNQYIVDDGTRSTDKHFQNEIDKIIQEIYKMLQSNVKSLTIL